MHPTTGPTCVKKGKKYKPKSLAYCPYVMRIFKTVDIHITIYDSIAEATYMNRKFEEKKREQQVGS